MIHAFNELNSELSYFLKKIHVQILGNHKCSPLSLAEANMQNFGLNVAIEKLHFFFEPLSFAKLDAVSPILKASWQDISQNQIS